MITHLKLRFGSEQTDWVKIVALWHQRLLKCLAKKLI